MTELGAVRVSDNNPSRSEQTWHPQKRLSPATSEPATARESAVEGDRQTGENVELRDGTRVLIRPIEPSDRERLNEGFESASAESIFMRFLGPQPRLSEQPARLLDRG